MSAPEITPVARPLTQPMIDRYAEASGDHNPIHIDEAFAKTTPMGGTIAHGMLVLSFISEMMTDAFGPAWLTTGKLDVRFRAPARPGETLTARAKPSGKDDDEYTHKYAVEVVNQRDEVLIAGMAEVHTA